MSKHTLEFKLSVVKHYQLGVDGQKATAKKFGIEHGAVRKWAMAYQHHGIDGLIVQHRGYTAEFKESVVLYMRDHNASQRDVAAKFNIPAITTIGIWERLYDNGGIDALSNKRGRPKIMPKPSTSPQSKRPISEMTQDELLAEIQHLRMENAYLKKLRALIQQQKLSATKSKRK
jgi:transposase